MRILLIMTGGTIGCVTVDGIMDTDEAMQEELIHRYQERYPNGVDFKVIRPYNLLSENLTSKHWETLHHTIRKMDLEGFDGIILTHGSDTLSYTSAMCAHLYQHLDIPFVLTASNHPLDSDNSNGLANFHTCVTFIALGKWTGVFSVYQNGMGENQIYLAKQIEEADVLFGQFRSFGGKPFAKRIREEIIVEEPSDSDCRHMKNKYSGNTGSSIPKKNESMKEDLSFQNKVLLLHSHPGLCYDNVNLTPDVKAVMLCLYHSSTACVEGKGYSVIGFMERCKERGVDLYLHFVKSIEGRRYATTETLLQAGGIPIGKMTKETAYTKLLLAYNQVKESPREYFFSE